MITLKLTETRRNITLEGCILHALSHFINLKHILKMKTIITTLLVLLIFIPTIAQQRIAKVQKINGVEVYIMAEPLREYEVVIGKGNSIKWSSFITGGLLNESVATKVTSFVNKIKKKSASENIDMDAIIYTNGKKIVAIKFTKEATDNNDRIAEVQKLNGYPVFVLNEPILDYSVEKDKGPGMKWKSFLTAGLINNSIEQDIDKYAKRFSKHFRKGNINAIQYTNGKHAIGIFLKQ